MDWEVLMSFYCVVLVCFNVLWILIIVLCVSYQKKMFINSGQWGKDFQYTRQMPLVDAMYWFVGVLLMNQHFFSTSVEAIFKAVYGHFDIIGIFMFPLSRMFSAYQYYWIKLQVKGIRNFYDGIWICCRVAMIWYNAKDCFLKYDTGEWTSK